MTTWQTLESRGEVKHGANEIWWNWFRGEDGTYRWQVRGDTRDFEDWKLDGYAVSQEIAESLIRMTVDEWKWPESPETARQATFDTKTDPR